MSKMTDEEFEKAFKLGYAEQTMAQALGTLLGIGIPTALVILYAFLK